jgi:hypothetical protein
MRESGDLELVLSLTGLNFFSTALASAAQGADCASSKTVKQGVTRI